MISLIINNIGGKNMSKLSVRDCIGSGYSSVLINTTEETRAIKECMQARIEYGIKLFGWTCTRGIVEILPYEDDDESENESDANCDDELTRDIEKNPEEYEVMDGYVFKKCDPDITDPQEALVKGLELNDGEGRYIFCIIDFHHYLNQPMVLRAAKDAFEKAENLGVSYIFISSKFEVPADWQETIISIELELPTKEDLVDSFNETIRYIDRNNKGLLAFESEEQKQSTIKKAAEISIGLTYTQADSALFTSVFLKRKIDIDVIAEVKAQTICKDGLLEFWSNSEDSKIGGMKNLKEYTARRILAYSDEAKKYGLPNPKGVLLVGIPGCGKSLAAKSIAHSWNVPLIKCDLGKLFGSYVGDTEANTRKALQIAETMAPCVLWIDEIEKGLAGAGSGGRNDSGVSSRMFASILTWMQEKKSPVYVVATANSITSLPSELLRKGRFDEIFFVGLPTQEEREEIVAIQLERKGRKQKNFDVKKIAQSCDGFTGAEIEEAIVSAMFEAYADNARELTSDDIISQMKSCQPASEGIMKDTVEALNEWASKENVRNANSTVCTQNENSAKKTATKKTPGGRVIRRVGGNKE